MDLVEVEDLPASANDNNRRQDKTKQNRQQLEFAP